MENVTNAKRTVNPETGTLYSHAELHAAFTKVQNAEHWKNPINAVIPEADQDITETAVIFFAGCVPTFRPAGKGKLRCKAAGYFVAVGA